LDIGKSNAGNWLGISEFILGDLARTAGMSGSVLAIGSNLGKTDLGKTDLGKPNRITAFLM
jgi:hypothetical protein